MPFLALIPLALTIIPKLIDLIAGDKAGKIASTVAGAVADITGTTDPVVAERVAKENPDIELQLRARLAEIAVEATKVQNAEAESKRQAELTDLKLTLESQANARGTMVSMAQAGSIIAWGAPVVSIIVTAGFFIILAFMMLAGLHNVDPDTRQILNIAVGALITGFTTVISYWIGSSKASQDKDITIRESQVTQAAQTSSVISNLNKIATTAVSVAPTSLAASLPGEKDSFDNCVGIVLAQEGGFVDNPADPGGPTNMGITIQTLSDWRGKECTVDDVRTLTKQEAQEIYRASYWNPMRCNDLPDGVDLIMFDFGVNAGTRIPVKALQRIVGVADDGSVGPRTLAGVATFKPTDLIRKLSDARLAYYRSLATWSFFGKGWTRRVEHVRSSAEAMTA